MSRAIKAAIVAFAAAWTVILIFAAFGEWGLPNIAEWKPFARQMCLYVASAAAVAAFAWNKDRRP